jgi:MoaA/NifB/PqqE/SkfB family radical SAM enzyme
VKNFCYVPFRELYFENTKSPKYSSCCTQENKESGYIFNREDFSFETDTKLQTLRQQFLNNEKPETCKRCWILEEKGIGSYRTQWNKKYVRRNISPTSPPVLEVLDIRLSNKCNLQCKMCGKEFSDQIAQTHLAAVEAGISVDGTVESIKFHANAGNVNPIEGLFDFLIKNTSVKQIKLAGGEPMIMPEVENLLIDLAAAGRTDLSIFCLTNATTVKSSVITALEKFDKVELSCSIDGVGKWIEYQRFPASSKVICKNYRKLTQSNIRTTLTPCWSQLNLLGIVEYFKWLEREKVNWLAFNEVTFPSYLQWELIPMKYRKELIEQLDSIVFPKNMNIDYYSFIQRIKTDVREITPDERVELSKAVKIWDFNNKVTYVDMFPWGAELLGIL